MAGVIPKENLAAYQRWHANSFDKKAPAGTVSNRSVAPATATATPEPEIVTTLGLPTADDIEQINESARAEGYQAGFEEGKQAGEAQLAETIAQELSRFSALLGNLQVALAHMDQSIVEQVLDLALEVASQVIRGTVATRSEALLPVIREAISALPLHHNHVLLHLNPLDATVVREQIGEQLTLTGTQIIDDAAISQGGCHLKAGTSEIDATIETRWKRVLEAIGSEPREWLSSP
jgi:flagellar assembly protein FliH